MTGGRASEMATDVNTKKPASVCILPVHYIYTVNARYAEPAFGRLTTRAIKHKHYNEPSWNVRITF